MREFAKLFGIIAVTFMLSAPAMAQEDASVLSKSDVNALVEQYIKDNPQVIIDSLEQHQRDQAARVEAEASEKLELHKSFLETGDLPRVGNPNGDIKIAEFYDYNCGYCKRAFTDLQLLLEADPNVEITFIEMPILGEASLETAKWSLASISQDKFFDYHTALMTFPGQKNPQTLKTLAGEVGLDVDALEVATNNEAIIDMIEKNIDVARDIGIRGTPGFVINGQIFRGYLGYDGLKAVIDEIRLSNAPAPAPTPTETEGNDG